MKQLGKKSQDPAGLKAHSHGYLHTTIRKAYDLGNVLQEGILSFSSVLRGPHDFKIIRNHSFISIKQIPQKVAVLGKNIKNTENNVPFACARLK